MSGSSTLLFFFLFFLINPLRLFSFIAKSLKDTNDNMPKSIFSCCFAKSSGVQERPAQPVHSGRSTSHHEPECIEPDEVAVSVHKKGSLKVADEPEKNASFTMLEISKSRKEFKFPQALCGYPVTWERAPRVVVDQNVPEYLREPAVLFYSGRKMHRISKGLRSEIFLNMYSAFRVLSHSSFTIKDCIVAAEERVESAEDTRYTATFPGGNKPIGGLPSVYNVRLYDAGKIMSYNISDVVPIFGNNEDWGGSSEGECWPVLLEKGIAAFAGGYENLPSLEFTNIVYALTGCATNVLCAGETLSVSRLWMTLLAHFADGDIVAVEVEEGTVDGIDFGIHVCSKLSKTDQQHPTRTVHFDDTVVDWGALNDATWYICQLSDMKRTRNARKSSRQKTFPKIVTSTGNDFNIQQSSKKKE
jgi:hypothetical protein